MTLETAYDVFLSHSSSDAQIVRRLAADLEKAGFRVWLDEWEIGVGDSIVGRVMHGLRDSAFVGLWLSAAAVTSGWVAREWYPALHAEVASNRVKILPLLGEQCDIPEILRDKRYADFTRSYEAGLTTLLQTLRARGGWTKASVERYIKANWVELRPKFSSLNGTLFEIVDRSGGFGGTVIAYDSEAHSLSAWYYEAPTWSGPSPWSEADLELVLKRLGLGGPRLIPK